MEMIFLKKPTVDEVLQQGIYGPLETKPEERRKFLGTLRERIVVALTIRQVREDAVYPQVEQYIKKFPKAHLLLNGNIHYRELSKYVKLAAKYQLEHTIVTNKKHETDIGLVLAMEYAIDKEEIYILRKDYKMKEMKKQGFLEKLFKKKK